MENKKKKSDKKPAKEASNLFHNIMAASVKGNPKPAKKKPEPGDEYLARKEELSKIKKK